MATLHDLEKLLPELSPGKVLGFAAAHGRILPTNNRRHFLRLHQDRTEDHAGIVLCTFDLDFAGQARRIHAAVAAVPEMRDRLLRIHRPG